VETHSSRFKECACLRAIYDLCKYPTTFDFAAWAVIAKTHGVDHCHFIIDGDIASQKYPKDIAWRRFGNILVPICALAGMDFSVGKREEGPEFPYSYGDVNKIYDHLGTVGKLETVADANLTSYVTVTFRESFRNTYRNSNVEAWSKFIQYLQKKQKDVVVFPECETQPIDIYTRMAAYCGAEMNLGTSGGPMSLCHLSDAPYLTFNMIPVKKPTENTYDMRKFLEKTGFPEGSQLHFRTQKQRLVWEPDDFETIVNAYEGMNDLRIH
jgi:hypothetical protein